MAVGSHKRRLTAFPGADAKSNPSACAVAYLHRYRDLVPASLLREVAAKAMSVVEGAGDGLRGHDFLPFIELAAEAPEPMGTAIWSALRRQVRQAVETDPAKWTGYGIRPLWAVPTPESPLMEALADAVEAGQPSAPPPDRPRLPARYGPSKPLEIPFHCVCKPIHLKRLRLTNGISCASPPSPIRASDTRFS